MSALAEPRIEPEIAFKLARAPEPDRDERAILTCIEWVAHGFEIVQSHYPGWRFTAADTIAAFGLHGAFLLGPPEAITPANADGWHAALAAFDISLRAVRDGRRPTRCYGHTPCRSDHARRYRAIFWLDGRPRLQRGV